VAFIFLVMLSMIVGSIVIELVLPQAFKDRLGTLICWGMMGITMTVLGLSTIGLIYFTWLRYLKPAFAA
jgi:hypothetical protein